MNGRMMKRIRKEARINFQKANIEFMKAVVALKFRDRFVFCFKVLFKRRWS